jgi:predicted metal-dependent phosphoesterase TrpH
MHSTASDGAYRPVQLVELARRVGLAAIAITDHDTLAGVAPARSRAAPDLEVISGVEISAEHDGREFHLLGYFFDPDDESLNSALEHLRERRVERFNEMIVRLRACGVRVNDDELPHPDAALGRRHLAILLF